MQIVIEVPEEYYDLLKGFYDEMCSMDMLLIKNGKPLPKGHGRLIDADDLKKEAVMYPTVGNSETLLLDIMDVDCSPTILEADKEGDYADSD